VALEIDPASGLLAYDEVDLVVMRQQGKSEFLFPLMTHRSVAFDKALTEWVNAELGVRLAPPGRSGRCISRRMLRRARAKWRDVHLQRIESSALVRSLIEARLRLNIGADAVQ